MKTWKIENKKKIQYKPQRIIRKKKVKEGKGNVEKGVIFFYKVSMWQIRKRVILFAMKNVSFITRKEMKN